MYDGVIFEQFENYQKGSYRNKCRIIQSSGFQTLSIPLSKGKNEKKPIREVEIHSIENWQRQHWQSIKTAYGRSPYFDYYGAEIEAILHTKSDLLFDYNLKVLEKVTKIIGMDLKYTLSETYKEQPVDGLVDLRNVLKPKKNNNNLDKHYIERPYPQVFEDRLGYCQNPSILDLIFCSGPSAILVLENSIIK